MGGRPKPSYKEVVNLFTSYGYTLLENEYIDSKTKMKYICGKHPEQIQSTVYSKLKAGSGCKYCGIEKKANKQRLSEEVVVKVFEEKGYILIDKYINNSTPMKYICPHHPDKETKISYADRRNGKGCPYCAGTVKHTIEEVIESFAHEGLLVLDSVYKDNKTKINYQCLHHPEKELSMTFKDFNKGHRCPYCSGVGRASYEEVKRDFEEMNYTLLEKEFLNIKTPMECYCNEHSDILQYKTYQSIKNKHGCKHCLGLARHNFEKVRQDFEDMGYILLSTEYLNQTSKLQYICKKHDHEIKEITYNSILYGKGCNDCGNDKNRLSYEYVKGCFEERGYALLDQEYVNNVTKMNYTCPKHPEGIRQITFNKLQRGTGCYDCYLESITGENAHNWKHDKTIDERIEERKCREYKDWILSVYRRDNFKCQCCGNGRSGTLNAHHKDGHHWCEERRLDVSNGVTLCEDCHKDFHMEYGFKNNTEQQYDEWISNRKKESA